MLQTECKLLCISNSIEAYCHVAHLLFLSAPWGLKIENITIKAISDKQSIQKILKLICKHGRNKEHLIVALNVFASTLWYVQPI